jgi:methionine-rich copper-binding protein CopC
LVFAGAASAVTNSEPAYAQAVETDNSAVDGHQIVYEKKYSDTDYDIFVTDLTTGTSSAVSTSSNDERNPDISGNLVVWQSKGTNTGGKWQIFAKNIDTDEQFWVKSSSNDQINPSVFGTYIVWQEYTGAADAETNYECYDYDIMGYDLSGNYYYQMTKTDQCECNPDISSNSVVYQKYENLGTSSSPNWKLQVYKANFGSEQATKIRPSTENQYAPVISEQLDSNTNKVLWVQFNENTSSSDIWCEDLATGTGFWVTQTTANEDYPAISGTIAVWEKWTGNNEDILMQDISSSSNPKLNVATGTSNQINAAVDSDYSGINGNYGIFVSYTDNKDGIKRVYWRNMDSTAPKATAGSPASNAVNVPVDKVITTTFNEPIKAGNMWITLKTISGTIIPITTTINGNVLTINHATTLTKGTKYLIELHTGCISDFAGNPIKYYYRYFTTDGTPPTAIAASPARNAVNVPIDKVITTTFNEPIKAGNMWITLKTISGTIIPITTTINGNVLTINHATTLTKGTKYLIELHTGCISDFAGNPIKYYYRYFTTDGTPPTATAASPARNAVNVAGNKVITTTFNEPIIAGNMWVTLKTVSGTQVSITPVINGNVLYIYHSALLVASTKYLIELHTGCISDKAGNLIKYYYRYFTTGLDYCGGGSII